MIFLRQTFFNTSTVATVTSGSSTVTNMIDKKSSTQYQTVGFNDDLTTSVIRLDFDKTQTVSNIVLLNHNLKDYNIKYNHPLLSSFATSAYDTTSTNPSGIAEKANGTLWITDSVSDKIYNVDVTGTLLNSFATSAYDTTSTNPTGIAEKADGTLWITDSSTDKIYNVDVTGTLLSSFATNVYDAAALSPSGIGVKADGTLWIADTFSDKIYNVDVTGTLLSSFATSVYDVAATVPSGIGVKADGTLWIIDNATDKIYNVDVTGTLLSSFATNVYDTAATIPLDIAEKADGTLWITDSSTDKIYNVSLVLTFTAFSPMISYATNSATSQYFAVSTITTQNIIVTMNKTITANEEKKIGELIVSNLFYDFTSDRLPAARNYRPEIDKKQIRHKMSDGGINIYNIANNFKAKIKLDFVPTSTEVVLKSIFDDNNPFIFIPFETTSAWNGNIYEVNWIGAYNFLQFADNNRGNGYKGQIVLQETTGRI